jgi:3-phenylpropionate/cinnamic acid dioxygenase small subunit
VRFTSTTSMSWDLTVLDESKPQASTSPTASLQELHFEIERLNSEYAHVLDNERYEEFPELFVEDCLYRVVPRENHLLGLPIAVIHCESRGMIKDRVYAARESTMAEPRTLRHFISNIRILDVVDDAIHADANVLIMQTMINRMTEIVLSGFYLDRIVRVNGRFLFKERLCIYDSLLLPTSLIAPV